jgi:hypothetical protein
MTRSGLILVPFFLWFGIAGCSHKNSTIPILILATDTNFGTYTAEILKAEGFNEFTIDSLTDKKVTLSYLNRFDVVILSETNVTQYDKVMLSYYVKAGGNLIAFRPDKQLSEIFGIIDEKTTSPCNSIIKMHEMSEILLKLCN